MKPHLLLLACGWLLAGHAAADLPEYDHHHPTALNEMAAAHAKVGAGGTALILLERANVILTDDPQLRDNLAALRAYLARPGRVLVETASTDEDSAIATETAPALPAPWRLP